MENFPDIPRPEDHGWVLSDGYLEPLWCEGDILPKDMEDVTSQEYEEETLSCDSKSDTSEDSENDLV